MIDKEKFNSDCDYVKKHNEQKIIISLLSKLDSIFDSMDCALDCPCHAYCDKYASDKHANMTLCTIITMLLSDLNR